jgi:hypothetical protein
LQGIETGIGLQHKDAVEAGVRLGLGVVDGEAAAAGSLQKAARAGIAPGLRRGRLAPCRRG